MTTMPSADAANVNTPGCAPYETGSACPLCVSADTAWHRRGVVHLYAKLLDRLGHGDCIKITARRPEERRA